VYKVPAVVGAVAAFTDCDVEFLDAPGLDVIDERPAVAGYKAEKKVKLSQAPLPRSETLSSALPHLRFKQAEADEAVGIVLRHFNIDPAAEGVRITFGGDLTAVSGIGASAAQVVSLARAIGIAKQLRLTNDEVRHTAGGLRAAEWLAKRATGPDL
jgi:mevalonate kinase